MTQPSRSEETVFLAARQLASAPERAAYVQGACANDEELRNRVLELLAAHDASRGPLDIPPPGVGTAATIDQAALEHPSTMIGPYKLLQVIGEGGMGIVYMAEQLEPVRRKVALKIIKPGMDTRQVIARFEAERQALSLMDHPNIAKVLDAGTTGTGRPFFVMEVVKGQPITEYCDQQRLAPRQRIELFLSVCQALQHAHQKGIIHRDVKPSNVLVAEYDGRPVAKVIDFGVAKAVSQPLTEKTMFTGLGQVVGTLEYMSPEQARVNQLDVDTRSDIYSLGVLLYELLTGSTPFDKQRLRSAAWDEMLRIIREEEPPKPSTRLFQSKDSLPSISAQRQTEPIKLTKLLRGELDWIVMKSLEKDRSRRYETANGFAADIQRYLNDEPVQACPPTAVYRLRKFARRNKGSLAVAALVLFFLVLLGSGVGWMVRDRSARKSRIGAQVALILAEVEQLEKEQKWPEALVAAQRAAALTVDGADAASQERVSQVLIDLRMVSRVEEVRLSEAYTAGAEGRVTAHHPHLYAAAFRDFGVDVETLPVEEAAARLRARPAVALSLAAALDDWGRAGKARDPDQSKRLWSLAATIDPDAWRVSVRQASAAMDVESLVKLAVAPDIVRQPPQSLFLLATSLQLYDRPEQALALLERGSEIHPGDYWIHYHLALLNLRVRPSRPDAALRHVFAARALRPRSAGTWINLGAVFLQQQKLDEAIAAGRRATELDPKNANAYSFLGWALSEQRTLDQAIAACRKAIELDPTLSNAHNNLGHALLGQRKLDQAMAAFKKAIELNPKDAVAYSNLGVALGGGRLAGLEKRQHDQTKINEAIDAYRKALEIDPKWVPAYRNLGATLRDENRPDEAIDAYRKAIEIDPNEYHDHFLLGHVLEDQRRLDEAAEVYRKALVINPKWDVFYNSLGNVLRKQKKWDEAIAEYRKLMILSPNDYGGWIGVGAVLADQEKWDEAIDAYRKAIEIAPQMANCHHKLGDALMKRGQSEEAAAAYRKVIEIDPKYYSSISIGLLRGKQWEEAVDAANKAIELDPKDTSAWAILGRALVQLEKWDAAIAACRKATELDPKFTDLDGQLAYFTLGVALFNQSKWAEAADAYRKVIELDPQNVTAYGNLGAALIVQSNLDAGIAACRKALELDPKYANARENLVNALARKCLGMISSPEPKLRDHQRAIETIKEAVEIAPQLAAAWGYQGWVQYRVGDWQASIESLEKSCQLEKGGTGDCSQWIVLALAHARLAASTNLSEKEREHHKEEARRQFELANKQIDSWWRVRPGIVTAQAIWDFRAEARELMAALDGKN